jgi:hypothetical protein
MNERSEIEQLIVDYIKEHKAVTFVQLQDDLAKHLPTKGDRDLNLLPNCIVWSGLSDELAVPLLTLLHDRVIDLDDVDPLVYFIDGRALDLPLAICPPKNGYREPRWLPAILRLAV